MIVVVPGPPAERAEPTATRILLEALHLRPRDAAARAGITEREMAGILTGLLHVAGPRTKWDARKGRCVGAWAELAESLFG